MVKHIRKPGIKAGFMGKFLKLGSMLLLLPLQISGHKQTPVHLGGRRSPRKGTIFGHRRWLAAPWPDHFWWMGLQAATGRFSSASKMLHGLQRNLEPTQGVQKARPEKQNQNFKKKGLSSSGDQVTASHLQGVDSPATQVPWEEWYPNVRSMILITPMKSISTLSSSQGVNIFMATAVSHGNPSRHQLLNFSEEGTHFPWLPAVPGYTLKNDT